MKRTRSLTIWTLLVGALWITAIALHVEARVRQAEVVPEGDAKPITMGIRN